MIPKPGCDPKINLLYIGEKILEHLRRNSIAAQEAIFELADELNVSPDHVILTLGWLYAVKAIDIKEEMVRANEIKIS